MPIDPQSLLPSALVMDIRTKPKETPLLRAALEKGCSVVYGYEMFISQAHLQFELWELGSPSLRPIRYWTFSDKIMNKP